MTKNYRLKAVTPTGFNSTNSYGFKVEYDKFSDPNKYFLQYGQSRTEQLLVEKVVDYEARKTTSKQYRQDASNPDEVEVTIDKYGRTSQIKEKNYGDAEYKTTTFSRQDLWESDGAAELTQMYDPYENRTYKYYYDDFNNCTGYDIYEGNGTSGRKSLSIGKIAENKTLYKIKSNIEYKHVGEIKYDENKHLDPRISETNDLAPENESIFSIPPFGKATYDYDKLGRRNFVEYQSNDGFVPTKITVNTTYKTGTLLKEKINTKIDNAILSDTTYEFTHNHNDANNRNLISSNIYKKTYKNATTTTEQTYLYDKANRLSSETSLGRTVNYGYNPDGSLATETIGNVTKTYEYNKGRLTAYGTSQSDKKQFAYDNIGNCTHYKRSATQAANMEWERGNLLKKYTTAGAAGNVTATYKYNSQGIRFEKVVGDKKTSYILDGTKLLFEYLSEDNGNWYMYDAEGIIGFCYKQYNANLPYYYVKDAFGNVIAILNSDSEVARYEYDAWGNCKVLNPNGTENTNPSFIGNKNPIRWKSQYFDVESGLYYIDGRYYSPETKQYLSPADPETIMGNAAVVYGLNQYLFTLTNPVDMCYNGHTIETNGELAYDPEALSDWDLFWYRYGGWIIGAVELIVGALLCITGVGASFGVGLIVAGASTLIAQGLAAAGLESKTAMQIQSALNIVAGIVMCFTPLAPVGASMIGAGIGGLIGGLISESIGGSYSAGWIIGNLVGGILGSYAYKGIQSIHNTSVKNAEPNGITVNHRLFTTIANSLLGG